VIRGLVDRALAPMRKHPALSITILLLWIATLVPIWRPRFLPLLDLPNHLDAIAIWHRYKDPAWNYSKFYRLNLLPLPYWGYFFPVHILSYGMPIEVANKVYLSAYALALPLGGMMLALQMGRSAWLALLVFPLVFNMNFSLGFITFCAGMTLMLYAFVMLDRFLIEPTRKRGIALCLVTLALYTTHVLPWLFFGVGASLFLFCHGLRWKRMITAAMLMLPSVALGAYAFHAARDGSTHVKPGPLELRAAYETLNAAIGSSLSRVLAAWPSERPYWIVLAFGVVWLFLMSSSRPDPEPPVSRGFRYRLELLVVLAGLAALLLPMHLFKPVDLWMIGGRFVSVIALFLALLPRGPIVGRGSGARGLLLVAVVFLHVFYVFGLTRQWREFDRRNVGFRHLVRRIPRGSSTLTLTLGDLSDPAVESQAVPYVQFHAYAQFFAGGYEPWALNTGFPMVPRPGMALPAPTWKQPHQFRFDMHGAYYDFILIRGESYEHQLFGPDDSGRAPMVDQQGDWRLYKVLDPQPPPPMPLEAPSEAPSLAPVADPPDMAHAPDMAPGKPPSRPASRD
jgi:hypothetical protein